MNLTWFFSRVNCQIRWNGKFKYHVFNSTFGDSFNINFRRSRSNHWNMGYQKSHKIGTQRFLEKVIWRFKWWCSVADYLRMIQSNIVTFSEDVIRSLLPDQSVTSRVISQLEFLPKIYRVSRCGCQIAIFAAKNGKEIIVLKIFCRQFQFDFLRAFTIF